MSEKKGGSKPGFMKTVNTIVHTAKFFTTQIGWIVGALILLIFLILVIMIVLKGVANMLGLIDKDDTGISSEADYEYMVSSLGYAGYDSLISEKKWQEFIAYEYAVLMDVAEYLYEGQKDYLEKLESGAIKYRGPGDTGPATMPYLEATAQYDLSQISLNDWKKATVAGQNAVRFGLGPSTLYSICTESADDIKLDSSEDNKVLGGSPNVSLPVISYEYKLNSYDSEQGSLVPYVTVVRDDLVYHYYTTGGQEQFDYTTKSNGVEVPVIDDTSVEYIKLLEINYLLNGKNGSLPRSSDYAADEIGPKGKDDVGVMDTGDKELWPIAEDEFKSELYFNDTYDSVTYKMPLQILVDRYLPKASLITTWFLLKDNDFASGDGTGKEQPADTVGQENHFDITMLINDMQGIYNYYCWGNPDGVETIKEETVTSIIYDEKKGTVKRDENGNAYTEEVKKKYADTHKETFIHFGQIGLETNRFAEYEKYKPTQTSANTTTSMPKALPQVTGDPDQLILPVINDLLSDNAYFLSTIDFKLIYDFDYKVTYYDSGDNQIGTPSTRSDTYEDDSDKNYQSGEVKNGGFSTLVYTEVVQPAEGATAAEGFVQTGESINVRGPKENLLNFEYVFPTQTKELDTGEISAELPPSFYDDTYKNNEYAYNGKNLACYNFAIGEDDGSSTREKVIEKYEEWLEYYLDHSDEIKEALEEDFEIPDSVLSDILRDCEAGLTDGDYAEVELVSDSVKLKDIEIKEIIYNHLIEMIDPDNPRNPHRAVYDVREEDTALKLDIYQKRLSAILVTDVETWAKSAEYTNEVIQNSFKPDDWHHVIPKCRLAFGLEELNITEKPKYRIEYYKQYFSKVANKEPGVKEADVLTMLMSWEEYGDNGVDSAYTFMRDLYKLVMFMREKGKEYEDANMPVPHTVETKTNIWGIEVEEVVINENYLEELAAYENPYILPTAYTYLYIPETIWNFREGLTQEIFWTERLAGKEYGNPDCLSPEEQEKVVTKKNEISWQILDYEEYKECENGDKTKVYALFPYGNSMVRTWFMQETITEGENWFGEFDNGNYRDGHSGADWNGRGKAAEILAAGRAKNATELPGKIYFYELKSRVLRNILDGVGNEEEKYNNALNFVADPMNPATEIITQFDEAKTSLDKELQEATVKSPIVAIAPGKVTSAKYNCVSGFAVTVSHTEDGKYRSSYVHFRRWPEVCKDDIVGAGTVLGYEGDTGNSTGIHLHFEVKRDGANDSPAEYVAPIFTPFYNADKITEFLAEYEDYETNELILSTEYMSLTRTVLMANFDSNGKVTEINMPDASMLESTSIYTIDGKEYVYAKEGGGRMYQTYVDHTDPSRKMFIIKVGTEPHVKYYKCEYDVREGCYIKNGQIKLNVFSKERLFEILNKEEVNADSVLLNKSIEVRVDDTGRTSSASLKWGVNTPLTPLLMDYEKLIDKNVFDAETVFDATKENWKNKIETGTSVRTKIVIGGWNKDEKDVRVASKYFTPEVLQEKFADGSLDAKVLMHYADTEMAYSVPFYEGPYSEAFAATMPTNVPGAIGTLIEDLAAFQTAVNARGFDNSSGESKMNQEGNYDSITTSVFKHAGGKLSELTDLDSYLSMLKNEGSIGENITTSGVGGSSYTIQPIVAWNTYVTFGTLSEAERAAYAAIGNAAARHSDAYYLTLIAICKHESSFIPSNESQLLVNQAKTQNLTFSSPAADLDGYKFTFKGQERIIRRAQGLFQVITPNGASYFEPGASDDTILTGLRTPYKNSDIGAKMIQTERERVIKNKMDKVLEIAELPKWQELGKLAGKDPVDLVLQGMATICLNAGYGRIDEAVPYFKAMDFIVEGTDIDNMEFTILNCPNYTNTIIATLASDKLKPCEMGPSISK